MKETQDKEELNLITLAQQYSDEDKARGLLESLLWPKYANEFAFRWNTRGQTDGERMETAIGMVTGKRLTYREAV